MTMLGHSTGHGKGIATFPGGPSPYSAYLVLAYLYATDAVATP